MILNSYSFIGFSDSTMAMIFFNALFLIKYV